MTRHLLGYAIMSLGLLAPLACGSPVAIVGNSGGASGGQVASGGQPSGGGSGPSGGAASGGAGPNGAGGRAAGGSPAGQGGSDSAGGTAAMGGSEAGGTSGTGGESAGSGGGTAAGGGDGSGGAGPTLPPVTDYTKAGPFETIVEMRVGPGEAYTVFRPKDLGEDGFLHAPIIFGPGIGQQVSVHTTLLTNFASHGFVVVGTPVLQGGPGDAGNRQKMQDGLTWVLEQNEAGGAYEGKLWPDHAVSMGFSVGGTSAVEVGGDPAVLTVVSIHGHRASADLHGTMLQTTGTQDTVGMPLQQATYDMSEVPTFLATLTGAPHGYIEQNGGGEERPAIVAWMRFWVYGDEGARDYFFGASCKLCQAPWENPQRKNWE